MRIIFWIKVVALTAGFYSNASYAQDVESPGGANAPLHVIVYPHDTEHNELSPETGSSTYVFNRQAIDNLPQGDAAPLNDVLLQAPGVAQDSYGQLHIRGDHDDLQYRINGIILPEGISGFGQSLDTHFADKVELITGALPAQYGYRTAGIVDITTKAGAQENGGRSSVMFGSQNTFEGNQEFYGSKSYTDGSLANYFFSGNYLQNGRGIEPPTSSGHPLHDDTTQDKEFGYLSYTLEPQNKLSVLFGNATNRFEIPNNPGQSPAFSLSGTPGYNSGSLNETQYEHNTYLIAALQGNLNPEADYQFALFTRYSNVLFKPDAVGDLVFNGIASRDYRESLTSGAQNDFSYRVNDTNILHAGWTFSYENAANDTNSSVFACCDVNGAQLSDVPFSIADNSSITAKLLGIYLQDEWKATEKLTINYGARFDYYDAVVSDNQLSPRIGAVYDLTSQTKLHAGYARYFTPPPTELISQGTVQAFQGTTGAPASNGAGVVVPEKDDYFDAGVIQKFGGLTLGVDGYYKKAHNLLDEGQFGQALIFAPFNYAEGWVRGLEFTGDYKQGAFSSYANLALSKAMGKDVTSGQYNFGPDELAYIQSNAVHLDHDQLISGSAGASYTFHDVQYSTDVVFGSGLRDGFANTDHLPFYTQVNLGVGHNFDIVPGYGTLDTKFSVINVFDRIYEIRDGSGIGVFAPQYGPRRGVFLQVSKAL